MCRDNTETVGKDLPCSHCGVEDSPGLDLPNSSVDALEGAFLIKYGFFCGFSLGLGTITRHNVEMGSVAKIRQSTW